jgi:hypothetical protein
LFFLRGKKKQCRAKTFHLPAANPAPMPAPCCTHHIQLRYTCTTPAGEVKQHSVVLSNRTCLPLDFIKQKLYASLLPAGQFHAAQWQLPLLHAEHLHTLQSIGTTSHPANHSCDVSELLLLVQQSTPLL